MRTKQQRILVVAPTTPLANNLLSWLGDAGYEVVVVGTFTAAKRHLASSPDAVITEVKLRDYNGLHLALRARAGGIPTAVVGEHDPVLEFDARQLDAVFLSPDQAVRDTIVPLTERLLSGAPSTRARAHFVEWPVLADRQSAGAAATASDLDWGPSGTLTPRGPVLH